MPIVQAKRLCPNSRPNRVVHKVTLSSPYIFGPAFTPYPLFQQSKDILLNLSMKCCNSGRSAETQHLMHKVWRLIIVGVKVRVVKIYVAAVEALRKKERQDETQFITKIDGFLSFTPS